MDDISKGVPTQSSPPKNIKKTFAPIDYFQKVGRMKISL